MSIVYDQHVFHYVVDSSGGHSSSSCSSSQPLIYLCMVDDAENKRRLAFLFLEEIQRRFMSTYGETAYTVRTPPSLPPSLSPSLPPCLGHRFCHERVLLPLPQEHDGLSQNLNPPSLPPSLSPTLPPCLGHRFCHERVLLPLPQEHDGVLQCRPLCR